VKVPIEKPNEFVAETQEDSVQDADEEEIQKWQSREVKNWHLSKPASGETAFLIQRGNEKTLKAKQDGEFIPLGSDDLSELTSGSYRPVYVKRCKPNPDKATQKKAKRKRK
jgi:hypothetical protein